MVAISDTVLVVHGGNLYDPYQVGRMLGVDGTYAFDISDNSLTKMDVPLWESYDPTGHYVGSHYRY